MNELLAQGAGGWGIGLLILAGIYATCSLGTSGGPNNGEHPLTTNILRFSVSLWALRGWPGGLRWTYGGILGAALVLSAVALPLRAWTEPRKVLAARAGMAVLYGAPCLPSCSWVDRT